MTIKVQLTFKAASYLKEFLQTGLYGHTIADGAGRLIDEGIQRRIETPVLRIPANGRRPTTDDEVVAR